MSNVEGRLPFRPSGCKALIYHTSCRPPLGTILQILSRYQNVVSGPRGEGRLFVRATFVQMHADVTYWSQQQKKFVLAVC